MTRRGRVPPRWRIAGLVGAAGGATLMVAMAPAGPAAAFPEVPNFCNGWSTGASQVVFASSFRRYTFTSDGTFTTPDTIAMPVRVLLVGGGGGGGAGGVGRAGGGGGGGAVLEYLDTGLSLEPGTTYTITIGQGGAGSASLTERGQAGTSTIVQGGSQYFEATGGAGGGSGDASTATGAIGTIYSGMPAGSSGGGGGSYTNAVQAGGTGATGAGNGGTGQTGTEAQATRRNGGGGGGASPGNGSNGTNTKGGNGGSGEANSDSTSTSTAYGGGGGGGGRAGTATGGSGGGGRGGIDSADPAIRNGTNANTTAGVAGAGGGGGANSATYALTEGGDGARGTVVIAHRANYTCPSGAPSGTPAITGTVAADTAVMTWNAPTTFTTPQAVASYTVLYYLPGGTSAGNIYARGGPVTPRSINISGATKAACDALNPAWVCDPGLSLSGEVDVTFKTFARTTACNTPTPPNVCGVGKLTASSPAVTYP